MPPIGLILILLLVAFPLLELALLIKIGSLIGVGPVLLIVIGTFILGLTVVRYQGLGVARRFVAAMRSGKPPVEPMVEGMLLVFAGGCLIAPGLITDAVGIALLIPPLRQLVAKLIVSRGLPVTVVMSRTSQNNAKSNARTAHPTPGIGPTIDGDFERLDEKSPPPPRAER